VFHAGMKHLTWGRAKHRKAAIFKEKI
jgi:hypothetical protein